MDNQIPTPDFETYSMDNPIVEAAISNGTVRVKWADGGEAKYHHMWLRDNCACEHCIDAGSHERVNSILLIPDDVHPTSVAVSNLGGLKVNWSEPVGNCTQSHYHPGWLRAFDYSNGMRPIDEWEIETWGQELEDNLPIFSANEVFNDENTRYNLLTTIRRLGLAIVTDMPKDFEAFERISTQIGLLRDMNWGKIFEIIAKPEGEYIANRGFALDAHSDAATREYMPGFQIFQCVENRSKGGESFWVDGFRIAEIMREKYPKDFALLSTVPWEQASRSKRTHYRWNAPVFDLDHKRHITAVRDTTWLREPLCTDFETVPKLFKAYRQFASLKAARENQVERKLVEGDVAFVDNRRALHGRRAFDPTSGLRHIRTCYGEREELLSSIRLIERARAMRVFGGRSEAKQET